MRTLLTLCALAGALHTTAQISVGPFAGLHYARYSLDNTLGSMGYHVGVVGEISLNEHFAVQPAIAYVRNVYLSVVPAPFGKVAINTLQIPAQVIWRPGKSERKRFFMGIGAYAAAHLSASTRFHYLDPLGNTTLERKGIEIGNDTPATIKMLDFGLTVSVGYNITRQTFLRAGFRRGLADISPKSPGTASSYAVELSVAYL
ncbi:MAG: porin family protein [Bacteroidota bacterium]